MIFIALVSSAMAGTQSPTNADPAKSHALKVTYGNSEWNQNSEKIDTAYLVMRDANSGQVVEIHLDETGPDTATFSGHYSISWAPVEQLVPEIFVPPVDLLMAADGLHRMIQMIDNDQLKRKPFIFRKDEKGQYNLEVFDSRDQVEQALEKYRAQARLAMAQQQSKFEDTPSQLDVEAQKLAKEKLLKQKLAEEAKVHEGQRQSLEQSERRHLEALVQTMQGLSRNEQNARKNRATKLAAQAMVEFRAGHFADAEKLFHQSVETDPTNRGFYFQYGVTLYKVDKYNESLVYLDLTTDPKVNPNERKYFQALNYIKLKETANALRTLHEVRMAKDKDISPSAAFYEGVLLFEDNQYENARAPFQDCIDTSNDPHMDETAETYIEQIARILAFEAERAKHFILTGTLGIQYDSNVPDYSTLSRLETTATGVEAERYNATLGLEWRHFYEKTWEFATKYFASTQYSATGTQVTTALEQADATMLTFYAPLRLKGLLFGKGNKFEVAPGVEEVMEAIEYDRTTPIVQSYVLKLTDTMVNRETWFTVYSLELRRDNSLLDSSIGDEDASANKYSLFTSNIFMLGKEKSKALNLDLGYALNNADGSDYVYSRTDANVGYRIPFMWKSTWNVGLNFYRMNYYAAASTHYENDYTWLTGFTRPVNDWLQVVTSFTYQKNYSNDTSKIWDKETALVNLVAAKSF
jgi:hypothetical protein